VNPWNIRLCGRSAPLRLRSHASLFEQRAQVCGVERREQVGGFAAGSRRPASAALAIYYANETTGAAITIHTPFGDVRDVGTRFEVRLRDDALRVRVRDG